MSTAEFPKDQWDALKAAMADGGPDAVLALVAPRPPLQRRQLLSFAAGAFAWDDWPGKALDDYVAVARAAIAEGVAQAADETDAEERRKRIDFANVCAYNLTARLADCWSDDVFERTPVRFETGLAVAEDCLRWRTELGKGPTPFSMAWWAKGMHELSLGRHAAARASLATSLEFAERAVRDGGDEPDPTRHFAVALGEGLMGIADLLNGDASGRSRWQRAVDAFGVMASNPDTKDDAEVGVDQLRVVWDRYGTD